MTGVFRTIQVAAPHLREGSSVILNGSVHAVLGAPGYSAYAASKAAVRAITRVLAAELAPRGIRVNQVTPGGTSTPIWGRCGPTGRRQRTDQPERPPPALRRAFRGRRGRPVPRLG